MAEWNRSDRDYEERRYSSERESPRRRSGSLRGSEERSFDDWNRESEQAWRSSGDDYGRDYGERYTRSGYQSEDYRRPRYGGQSIEQQGYGHSWRNQRYGSPDYGARGYGDQDYRDRRYGARTERGEDYGHGDGIVQTGMGPQSEMLQRVSDGDLNHGFGRHGGEHRGRGPKNYTRSDDRIREDVNDRLSDDSWLDASNIDVQVSQCEVTLTGVVHSRQDKRRAEDIAEDVSGVKHVQNNLRVQQLGGAETALRSGE